MDHSFALFWTLSAAFVVALACGYVANRLKLPPLVGYLFAGILLGQNTPGPAADLRIASELSEVGVMLLMFGVGLHFSMKDLLKVKSVAVPGALLQMTLSTVLGMAFSIEVWNWSMGEALVFGLCLSCASTVVFLKALEMLGKTRTTEGQIAIGWLVVEDIGAVVILVLLPPVAVILGADGGAQALTATEISKLVSLTMVRVVAFVALMLVVGRKVVPWLLRKVAQTASRELFTLSVLAVAIGVAFMATTVFSVSFALGAFFAGMVMQESQFARRAAKETVTLQDAFSALFFVGVGMLLDWHILISNPGTILCMLGIIIFGTGTVAFVLVHLMKFPLHTSLTVAAGLTQIGEFSYILAQTGISLKLVDEKLLSMVVAASIISIALNTFVFKAIPFVRTGLLNFKWARKAAMLSDPYSVLPQATSRKYLSGQVVLVGTSFFNKELVDRLDAEGIPYVSVVEDSSMAEEFQANKRPVIVGDPTDAMVLVQAHIFKASMIVISSFEAKRCEDVVKVAKELNPDLKIIVRFADSLITHQVDTSALGDVVFDSDAVRDDLVARIQAHYKATEALH